MKTGETKATFRLANLEKPRISDAGKLTFIAKVEGKLPKNMNDFSINISRPASTPRYPLAGPVFNLDSTHQAQGYILDELLEGYIQWSGTDGSRSECSEQTGFDGPGVYDIPADIVCAGLIISNELNDGTPSYVQVTEGGQVNVSASYGYEDGSTTQGASARAIILMEFFYTIAKYS